jgi:hypothetical protein
MFSTVENSPPIDGYFIAMAYLAMLAHFPPQAAQGCARQCVAAMTPISEKSDYTGRQQRAAFPSRLRQRFGHLTTPGGESIRWIPGKFGRIWKTASGHFGPSIPFK